MKNDVFFGLSHLVKSKKNILWVGSKNETPPQDLGPVFDKIKFVAFDAAASLIEQKSYHVVVISVPTTVSLDLSFIIEPLKKDVLSEKLLLLHDSISMSDKIFDMINQVGFCRVLSMPKNSVDIISSIEYLLTKNSEKNKRRAYASLVKNQNQLIESKNIDIESLMYEREQLFALQKEEIEKKLTAIKSLVTFVKGLSHISVVDEVMQLLWQQSKRYHKVKEPIMTFASSDDKFSLIFFQGSSVIEKEIRGVWPQQIRIRLNDVKDSQFLADIFGRPFAKLLTIPLKLKRKLSQDEIKVSAVLFFEHDLAKDELPGFLQFIEDRLQPISIALDRLLLEQDAKEASLLWEKTFDGLLDPVAIFDSENKILRANKSFSEALQDINIRTLISPSFQHKGRYFKTHSYPISFGGVEKSTNLINHYVDVTRSRKLHNQMVQNEKMAALGQLAGNIAHELNNPLTGIRSLAQILIQQNQVRQTLHNDLSEVERAAERCQIIIKNLQDFSTGGIEKRKEPTSVNEIVNKTLPLLKTLISRFTVDIKLTDIQHQVLVEPHLMQQVIFNLIKNAAQSMAESGNLCIETEVLKKRGVALIKVRDTGCGISEEDQDKIFDFFYTTKMSTMGTGIGLSMSKSIVDRFGGQINLKSRVGHGSEFVIQLPILDGAKH